MLETSATVVKAQGQSVWLAGSQDSGCATCAQKAACSASAIADMFGKKPVLANTALALQAGDRVVVEIDESVLLRAAALLYLLPLLGLFVSVVVADACLPPELAFRDFWLAGSALLGLLLAFNGVGRYRHGLAGPKVVRKLP